MLQRCNRSAYRGALHPRLLDKPSCGHPSFTGFHLFFFFKHCDDGGRCLGVHKETARSFYVLQMSPLAFGNRFLRALGAFRRLDTLQPCDDTQHDPLGIVLKKTVPVGKITLRICKVAHSARLHIERANRRHKIFYLRAKRSRIAAHRTSDSAGNAREFLPPAVSLCAERAYEYEEIRSRRAPRRARAHCSPPRAPRAAHSSPSPIGSPRECRHPCVPRSCIAQCPLSQMS